MVQRQFSTLFLISIICFFEANAEIDNHLQEDFFKIYKHKAFEAKEHVKYHVTKDQIKYFLFTKEQSFNYTEIDPSNAKELNNDKVRIVFIIHGWTETRKNQWYEDLKNAFLSRQEEYYVVQVDWREPANQFYTISSWNTKAVGNFVGEFVVGLHKNYSIPLKNFLIVGHSLGGQVAGYVGKAVEKLTSHKLPRIIGLDPAGPLFNVRPEAERLNKTDAEVVHVIHTNGGTFGFYGSSGTIDFFPNGGSHQPGCKTIESMEDITAVACDHQRSWRYFIEAVQNPGSFMATKCKSWTQFKKHSCERTEVAMGDLETKETGNFYLDVNKSQPFTKKKREGFGLPTLLGSHSKIL